jgi:hypothetical protein
MNPGEGSALELAAKRLERAVGLLEQKMAQRVAEADAGGLFDQDRARLAADLDAAKARERALEEAGEQASAALGRAIAEIRAALGDEAGDVAEADEADESHDDLVEDAPVDAREEA